MHPRLDFAKSVLIRNLHSVLLQRTNCSTTYIVHIFVDIDFRAVAEVLVGLEGVVRGTGGGQIRASVGVDGAKILVDQVHAEPQHRRGPVGRVLLRAVKYD